MIDGVRPKDETFLNYKMKLWRPIESLAIVVGFFSQNKISWILCFIMVVFTDDFL
jgi:hypothetical protein